MEERCAYCYATQQKLLCCGQCQKRKYCSKDCQKLDWKYCHHRHFCKAGVGEFGVAWEVKESPTNEAGGLGVFALRPIQKDEIIMVERPILTLSTGGFYSVRETDIPETARPAVEQLYPPIGTLGDKFRLNGMSTTDDDEEGGYAGLFIRMSRVNHNCIGNSTHRCLLGSCESS